MTKAQKPKQETNHANFVAFLNAITKNNGCDLPIGTFRGLQELPFTIAIQLYAYQVGSIRPMAGEDESIFFTEEDKVDLWQKAIDATFGEGAFLKLIDPTLKPRIGYRSINWLISYILSNYDANILKRFEESLTESAEGNAGEPIAEE